MNTTDGITVETRDHAVLACLAYHNRLPAMLHADKLGDRSGMPRTFIYWTSGKLLYVVAHFRNYKDRVDNGYAMLVLDLGQMSMGQFRTGFFRANGGGVARLKSDRR